MSGRFGDIVVFAGLAVLCLGIGGSLALVVVIGAISGASEAVPVASLGRALLGTLAVGAGAVVLAAPMGVGLALWARWLAPPGLRDPAAMSLSILGDIPPACLAVALLALPVSAPAWTWAVVIVGVALVAVPTVSRRALEALDRVPNDDVLQAIALGARPSEAVAMVVLPRARRDLVRSTFAGLSRALGETVIVVVVLAGWPAEVLTRTVVVSPLAPSGQPAAVAMLAAIGLIGLGIASATAGLLAGARA